MVKSMDYVEQGLAHYEAQVLETRQRLLRKLAKQFGQQLVPIQAESPLTPITSRSSTPKPMSSWRESA